MSFRSAYGKFELSDEATEGLVSLVTVGAGMAAKAASAGAAKKAAKAKAKSKKAKSARDNKRLELEAKIAEAQARAAAATAPPATSGVPGWAIGLSAGAVLGLGGFIYWRSQRRVEVR
jgi:hypothetical protein